LSIRIEVISLGHYTGEIGIWAIINDATVVELSYLSARAIICISSLAELVRYGY
jgi:hypothetical protein